MADFVKFQQAVRAQFDKMAKGDLFRVDLDKSELWDAYLGAFPEGTNPIYKERTEHDCNCCRQFIKELGGVVSINEDGSLTSVWDGKVDDPTYQVVADVMAGTVKAASVKDVFRHNMSKVGTATTRQMTDDGTILNWNHFSAKLPNKVLATNGKSVAQVVGYARSNYQVLKRSIEEIAPDAVDVVLELIGQNALYRGQEHKSTVKMLQACQQKLSNVSPERKDNVMWKLSIELGSKGRIRNTVIGTLMTDLSEGVDLERAVKSFEEKVAPHNYRRPTALITQGMIKKAEEKVEELGIEASLHRRFAVESDLTINNVLFADRDSRPNMKGGVFDDLKPTAKQQAPSLDKVQEVTINDFIENILPKAESLEMFVENRHMGNFMSLVAPVYDDAPGIFQWNNNFSWSYAGEVTDSIKERVKNAGGNVTGDVRVSLSWFNKDDLDIHVEEPGGFEIYFGNKRSRHTGGALDVDMNAGGRMSREPVENIVWPNKARMKDGTYKVWVNNYRKRESVDVGFEVEVEINGRVFNFSYEQAVANNKNVNVLELKVDKQGNVTIGKEFIPSNKASREQWGVSTEQFVKAKMVMNSPNHWDGQQVGNKHWFFILEDCANPDKARGFYNEFLTSELVEHRKVFEVLGSKMKTEESSEQLSGLGFSSTQRNDILCKVRGSFNRTVKIKF